MPISQQIDSLTLIGKTDVMQQLYKMIGRVCNVDCAVLLIGEKGSGRGVVARALHYFSHRAAAPFNLLGADDTRETNDEELLGIDLSHPTDSTYYITDYTLMPHLRQQQLLNIHKRKEFKCAHTNRHRKHNFRFLVAAAENIDEDLQNGNFPVDLFYDWNFIPIYIAPLRDRREDIPLHANQFLELLAWEMKVSRKELTPEALETLVTYEWPGNMNELKETLRTALTNCRGNYIRPEHLPKLRQSVETDTQTLSRLRTFLDSRLSTYVQNSPSALSGNLFRLLLPQMEKSVFDYALRKCNGNRNKAAQLLGLHRNTLNKKLQQYSD
jgi:two-component system nitrogen regulation response regulator GlnG